MFKIGDFIKGLKEHEDSEYNWTNKRMLKGYIIDVDEDCNDMQVEIVTMQEGFEHQEERIYWVNCDSTEFAVITPFKVGDWVKGLEDTELLGARVIRVDEDDDRMKIVIFAHEDVDYVGRSLWCDNDSAQYKLVQEPTISIGDEMFYGDTKATVLAISNLVDYFEDDKVAILEWTDCEGDGRVTKVALHELVPYPGLTLEDLLELIKENEELPGGDNSPEAYVKALRTVL